MMAGTYQLLNCGYKCDRNPGDEHLQFWKDCKAGVIADELIRLSVFTKSLFSKLAWGTEVPARIVRRWLSKRQVIGKRKQQSQGHAYIRDMKFFHLRLQL